MNRAWVGHVTFDSCLVWILIFGVDAVKRRHFSDTRINNNILQNDVLDLWERTNFCNIHYLFLFGVWENECNPFIHFTFMFHLYKIKLSFTFFLFLSGRSSVFVINVYINIHTYDIVVTNMYLVSPTESLSGELSKGFWGRFIHFSYFYQANSPRIIRTHDALMFH